MEAVCKGSLEQNLKRAFIWHSGSLPDNGGMSAPSALLYRVSRAALLVGALLCAWTLPTARARDDDHEQAHRAVQAGEVMPLRTVLERLEREHPGQVLDVELEQDDGRWIYEIKLLQPGGQRVKLKLDARTADLIQRKDRDRRR